MNLRGQDLPWPILILWCMLIRPLDRLASLHVRNWRFFDPWVLPMRPPSVHLVIKHRRHSALLHHSLACSLARDSKRALGWTSPREVLCLAKVRRCASQPKIESVIRVGKVHMEWSVEPKWATKPSSLSAWAEAGRRWADPRLEHHDELLGDGNIIRARLHNWPYHFCGFHTFHKLLTQLTAKWEGIQKWPLILHGLNSNLVKSFTRRVPGEVFVSSFSSLNLRIGMSTVMIILFLSVCYILSISSYNLQLMMPIIWVAILLYGYCLTFVAEAERCWGVRQLNWTLAFFYLNRYLVLLGHAPIMLEYFWSTSNPNKIEVSILKAPVLVWSGKILTGSLLDVSIYPSPVLRS